MSTFQPTPTSFQDAADILASGRTSDSRDSRKIANNTRLETRGPDAIAVELHSTDVVTFHRSGAVSINSGGWQSVTTKERINRYLPAGVSLFQEKHEWYVQDGRAIFRAGGVNGDGWGKEYRVDFRDGLLILPDASLHGRERDTSNATA
jgi:hypothetical protein